jgi:hypothetical protein
MKASTVSFIAKVFALSALIGILIKYGTPFWAPAPSLELCLVFLLAPPALMAVLFLRQSG